MWRWLFILVLFMAELAHASSVQTTAQTTGSTSFSDVSGVSIASSNFVAGRKYLLLISANVSNTSAGRAEVQLIHGSTAFGESLREYTVVTANEYTSWAFFTVWEAVASEDVKMQFRAITNTCKVDQIELTAIDLTLLRENTHWLFAERSTDDALSTSFTDGASVTFTPEVASHDWLVLTYAQIAAADGNRSISRLNESVGATTAPSSTEGDNNFDGTITYALSRSFTFTAASRTVKEEAATNAGTSHTRQHSSIFLLDLHQFAASAHAYTDADANLSNTNYATQLQTISITPTIAGDVVWGGYWGFDRAATGREGEWRIQIDNADDPAGQTTDNYQFDADNIAASEQPETIYGLTNLSAAAHTFDLDASADATTNTPTGQNRHLFAFSTELAGRSMMSKPDPMAAHLVR